MNDEIPSAGERGGSPLLTIRDLTISFAQGENEKTVVSDVNVDVPDRGGVAVVGESGSGKTLTALSILRLLPRGATVKSGQILFGGEDLLSVPASRLRKVRGGEIGMIFQDPTASLNPAFTVGNQLVEQIRLHDRAISGRAAEARAAELLGLVEIPRPHERLRLYPHEMSGGMAQRVMIAMAISANPRLLLADEPTTALDVTVQVQILDLIKGLGEDLGMGLLIISHDFGVVAHAADQISVMYRGEIVESGETARVLANPRHPYVVRLLNSAAMTSIDTIDRTAGQEPAGLSSSVGQVSERTTPQETVEARPLLSVSNLSKEFPIRSPLTRRTIGSVAAVQDVTFQLERGRTLGLVGESGSGKTTIGRMITQFIEPTSGTIEFKGVDLTKERGKELRATRRKIQMIFQNPYQSLNPLMTVRDIVAEPITTHTRQRAHSPAVVERVDELLTSVGLQDFHDRHPHQLSGGQRQRVAIARALSIDPELIVCDELTSALDVSIRADVVNLLIRLQKEYNFAYLFISHDLGLVHHVSDDIMVLYRGQIVEHGQADQVYESPREPYTQELLSSMLIPGEPRRPRPPRKLVPPPVTTGVRVPRRR